MLLFHPVFTYAISDRVRGARLGLVASPADRLNNVHEWTVRTRSELRRR